MLGARLPRSPTVAPALAGGTLAEATCASVVSRSAPEGATRHS